MARGRPISDHPALPAGMGPCSMTNGRMNPKARLEAQSVTGLGSVDYNYIERALVETTIARGEGRLGKGGAFLCTTGQFTGRSPKDKFVVRTPSVKNSSGGKTTHRCRLVPSITCMPTCWRV